MAQFSDGVSTLRRLEIRYLPLDPLLVRKLFKVLGETVVLQELILTDDSLSYCELRDFDELYFSLQNNHRSPMTLIDFSRNQRSIDDNDQFHNSFIDALKTQKLKLQS